MRDLLKQFESSIDAARSIQDLIYSNIFVNEILDNVRLYNNGIKKNCPDIQTDIHDMSVADETKYDFDTDTLLTHPGSQRDTLTHSIDFKKIVINICKQEKEKVVEFIKQLIQLRNKINSRHDEVIAIEERERETSTTGGKNKRMTKKQKKNQKKKQNTRKRMQKKKHTKKRRTK